MKITVKQLKGLIREAVREVNVKRIHEQASDVEAKKAELVAKWKDSGIKNGMPDWEWAQQMYQTGEAMDSGNEEKLSMHGLDVKFMMSRYPGFTAEDFKDVARRVDPEVGT